jgi:hypothetical protein
MLFTAGTLTLTTDSTKHPYKTSSIVIALQPAPRPILLLYCLRNRRVSPHWRHLDLLISSMLTSTGTWHSNYSR